MNVKVGDIVQHTCLCNACQRAGLVVEEVGVQGVVTSISGGCITIATTDGEVTSPYPEQLVVLTSPRYKNDNEVPA